MLWMGFRQPGRYVNSPRAVLVLGLKVQEEVVLLKACECQLPEEQQELGQELYSQRRAAFSEMGSRSGREEKYPDP